MSVIGLHVTPTLWNIFLHLDTYLFAKPNQI
jgi:hypothetical protein